MVGEAFWVGHEAEYEACFIADSGYVVDGAVGVGGVFECYLVICFELLEGLVVGGEATFAMGDG